MNQNQRIILVIVILLVLVGIVLGVDFLRRQRAASSAPDSMPPGSIPIFMEGNFAASFLPDDLNQLESASFVDAEEGKTQEGWMLRDVLLLYIDERELAADTRVTVASSSREKAQTLSWAEIEDRENMVLFDVSGRGTLKLVSRIPGFDIRDTWVQDVDSIEIDRP